jgi:signal transduction histidine kinase
VTLRSKLLLAQAPLAAAVILLGAVALWSLETLGHRSQNILKDNYASVLAAERMKEAVERIDSATLFRVAGRADKAEPQIQKNIDVFEEQLRLQEGNLTEPGERAATETLRQRWTEYRDAVLQKELPRAAEEGQLRYFEELEPRFAHVKEAADEVLTLNQDTMVRKSDDAQRSARRMTTLLLFAAVLCLFVGVVSTSSLTARLLRPLFALSAAVRRLGEGDVEARALVIGRDEIADLSREFNTMAAHLAQYRRSSLGELLQAQQSSQAAIDSLPDPVVIFGDRGEVLSSNRAAAEMLGIALELNVKDPLAQAPGVVREAIERVRAHVLGGKGPYAPRGFEESIRVSLPAGERAYLPRATPFYAEEGGIMGAAVLLQDVTRLLFFDQFKTDMVATVAHEFRTPLTSLHMAIHLCLEGAAGPITEKQADLLHAAREDCERLQSIVDELLDASRIQSGHLELHPAPIRPADLLEVASESREEAEERGIQFEVSDETAVGDEIRADVDRLRLVLSNLVQNAVRHTTPGGEVTVRARPDDGTIRFEVSDSGEGIPAEFHQRIFEKYFQIPGAPSGGAGLGLYISREVVLAHGGEMGVQSEPGRGSTFWFTVPKVGAV